MSVSQYRWQGMPIEKAQQIVALSREAIAAHQAGGMRSPDPAVRLAVIKMPLNGETFEDRMRAKRRLQPVLDDFERTRQEVYRAARASGLSESEARAFAAEKAAPIKKKVDALLAKRRAAKALLEEQVRSKKLADEREKAKKAGFR
jgi:hypothetical protein